MPPLYGCLWLGAPQPPQALLYATTPVRALLGTCIITSVRSADLTAHVADIEHQGAVDGARGREAQAQPAGPVGDGAGPVGAAPAGRGRRLGHIDGQVGACGRGDAYLRCLCQQGCPLVDPGFEGRVGKQPFEDLGVFVGDHEDPGAAGEDGAQFGGV